MQLTFHRAELGAHLSEARADQAGRKRHEHDDEYLESQHGIVFDHLFTITNMPIGRFSDYLRETGKYEAYIEKLIAAYNPAAAQGVMCRTTLSVDWEGRLFDCDFNQMLEMSLADGPATLWDLRDLDDLVGRPIATGMHCFGCTAGTGSSCGGALT